MATAREPAGWPDGVDPFAELLVPGWQNQVSGNIRAALVAGPDADWEPRTRPLTRDDLVAAMDRLMGLVDAVSIGLEPARLFPQGVPDVLPLYVAVFRTGEPNELPLMLELVDGRYRPMEGVPCGGD